MPTSRAAYEYRARKRRQAAADISKFASYIATPFDLSGGDFVMPANGRLAVASTHSVSAGDIAVVINGTRTMTTPALAANRIYKLDVLPRGSTVSISGGTGDLSVYVLNQWSMPLQIAGLAVVAYDTLAQQLFTNADGAGGTISLGRKTLINDLIVGLRADGVIPLMDGFGLMGVEDDITSMFNIITGTQITKHGTPTFVADEGWHMNNTSGNYFDTGLTPGSLTHLSTNSAGFGAVSFSPRATGQDVVLMGTVQISGAFGLYPRTTGAPGSIVGDVNNGPFSSTQAVVLPTVKGAYHVNRSAAGATQIYTNSESTHTGTAAAGTMHAKSFLIGAWRNSDDTTIYAMGDDNIAAWWVTSSLDATKAAALHNRLNTYYTAIGTPIWGDFDVAASAYFAELAGAGGTLSSGLKEGYNNFFRSLRAISPDLSNFNRVFVYAGGNQITANIDLINLEVGGTTLTPTWTAGKGYTTNGVDNDVDTMYDPTNSTPATLQDSVFIATYVNALGASNASGVGTPAGTFPQMEMVCPYTDGDFHAQINDSGFGGTPAAVGAVTGLFIADRTGPMTVVLNRDGTDLVTSTDASTGVPSGHTIRLGAANPVESQSRYAFFATGPALDTNRGAFSTAVIALMNAIGSNA